MSAGGDIGVMSNTRARGRAFAATLNVVSAAPNYCKLSCLCRLLHASVLGPVARAR
jgi:hypothetical protein